jgi:hypothetical protein
MHHIHPLLIYFPAPLAIKEAPDGSFFPLLDPPARDAMRYIKATTAKQRMMVASCQLSATSDSTGGGGRGAAWSMKLLPEVDDVPLSRGGGGGTPTGLGSPTWILSPPLGLAFGTLFLTLLRLFLLGLLFPP